MQPWMYAIIAVLPVTAFWTAYKLFKILEKRDRQKHRDDE